METAFSSAGKLVKTRRTGETTAKVYSTILSGVAGEYFVAAELSRMGYIASITLRNTKGVDILASSADASTSVGIQVKTNRGSRRKWLLNRKAEDYFADNLFYVFVNLNDGKPPDFYIVSSRVVAQYITVGFRAWLETPGRHGKPHKDNPMRMFDDLENDWLGRWDVLGLGE